MNKLEIALAKKNGTINELYAQEVIKLIRAKYSQNEENAILRKKLANIDTKNEFAAYNNYVEECKAKVKANLGI